MKIANINMQEGAGESCCKSNRQFSYFRLPLRIQMYATFFSILLPHWDLFRALLQAGT